ncbi:MAG: hypothetical protein KAR17_05075, partial [Cyclobacteriaceae bacterium]|nr:hypothetical protein [Cyclobacteriaceae bacterium]
IAAERIPSRRRRLMFEAERVLLADMPFVPVYTYVTKRMVNPRLTGWQSNVMDHHYSKDMFFLKAASDVTAAVVPDLGEETATPGDGGETMIIEGDAGTDVPAKEKDTAVPVENGDVIVPAEEAVMTAPGKDDETIPEGGVK